MLLLFFLSFGLFFPFSYILFLLFSEERIKLNGTKQNIKYNQGSVYGKPASKGPSLGPSFNMPRVCVRRGQLTVTTPHNACIPQTNFDRKVGLRRSSAAIGIASSHMISPPSW